MIDKISEFLSLSWRTFGVFDDLQSFVMGQHNEIIDFQVAFLDCVYFSKLEKQSFAI